MSCHRREACEGLSGCLPGEDRDDEAVIVWSARRRGRAVRRHHRGLLRAVARSVNASEELIEDACQSAWVTLLRCQPDRSPALFAWLRTVAVHQAFRLSHQERRNVLLEDGGGDHQWEALLGLSQPLEDAIEARRALETLAALPVLQRDDLALLVAGFSYREIATRIAAHGP